MRFILPTFLALGGSAAAECATSADLTGLGIALTYESGGVEIQRHANEVTNTSTWTQEGETDAPVLLARGVYFVKGAPIESFLSEFEYRPIGGYAALPVPEAGLTRSVETMFWDGYGFSAERWEISIGDETNMTFGACTYRMLPVSIDYYQGEEKISEEIDLYFPDLGVGAFIAVTDVGEEFLPDQLIDLAPVR